MKRAVVVKRPCLKMRGVMAWRAATAGVYRYTRTV
jgi:hypothetical protein